MKVLLRDHGMNLSGVKSDLYTVIGECFVYAWFGCVGLISSLCRAR